MTFIPAFIFLTTFVAFSAPNPVQPQRLYHPTEDALNSRRFIYKENEIGEVELVDLTRGIIHEVDPSDVTYHLYTQKNIDTPHIVVFNISNPDDIDLGPYDKTKLNLFVCHGWQNSANSSVGQLIKSAALENYDINVFVVDWSTPANYNYISAMTAVVDVGNLVGAFINKISQMYQLDGSAFVLVGHSLGAHVVGNAGAIIKSKVDHIVGMDPAGPLFQLSRIDNRLDETDANFVQIIHTNGLLLGFATSIGHADYFPNGGMLQPGCGLDITGSCSHSRSYQYFAESLRRGAVFQATLCDSYDNFENNNCSEPIKSPMGLLNIDKKANGDFYLFTNKESPFGIDE